MPWRLDNFDRHVQYVFYESFTSIPKYVYFSYTKTLKHCFLVTNDGETKLTFRPWLLDDKT